MQPEGTISPFPGPRPFTSGERERFFGRAAETRDVTALVIAHPLTVLHGAEGAGKTSLIAAGVVPALERAGFQVLPVARVGGAVPPGVDRSRLRNVHTLGVLMHWHPDATTIDALASQSLAGYLQELPRGEEGERPLAIVIDQLEDLFTGDPTHWDQREAFLRELAAVLQPTRGRGGRERTIRVLLAIEQTRLAELEAHAGLLPDLMRVRYHLDALTIPAAIEALTGPAKQIITRPDAEALARSLAQRRVWVGSKRVLVASEFVEPMHLQLAGEELWARNGRPGPLGRTFDPDEALDKFHDEAIARARKGWGSERKIRRWLSERAQTPDGRRVGLLRGKRSTGGLANELVDRLERERILRVQERLGSHWYEVAHDRLLAPIQRSNAAWFAAQRRRGRRWRITFVVLLLLAAAAGVAFLVDTAWRMWKGAQAEKLALEGERGQLVDASKKLEAKLELAAAQRATEALVPKLWALRVDLATLASELRAVQLAVFDMGRYRPTQRDVELESETITNFLTTGAALPGLGERVEAAAAALQAFETELDAVEAKYKQPELDDVFKQIDRDVVGPGDDIADLRRALEAVRADYTRFSTRLSENLDGFESPPRGGTLTGRVREQSRVLWREGVRAALAGDLETAKARYARALDRDSTNPAAHDALARLSLAAGQADAAAPLFQQALSRDFNYGPALASMAQIYEQRGELADAAQCVRRTLAVQPDHALAVILQHSLARKAAEADERDDHVSADNPCVIRPSTP